MKTEQRLGVSGEGYNDKNPKDEETKVFYKGSSVFGIYHQIFCFSVIVTPPPTPIATNFQKSYVGECLKVEVKERAKLLNLGWYRAERSHQLQVRVGETESDKSEARSVPYNKFSDF